MTNRERYRASFQIQAPEPAIQAAIRQASRAPRRRFPLRPLLVAAALLALLITAASA